MSLNEVGFKTQVFGSLDHALVGELVERAVVDAPHVGDETNLEPLRRLRTRQARFLDGLQQLAGDRIHARLDLTAGQSLTDALQVKLCPARHVVRRLVEGGVGDAAVGGVQDVVAAAGPEARFRLNQSFDLVVDAQVHALDRAADEPVGAGRGAAAEGGVVLVLVHADYPGAQLGGPLDAAGAGGAAGAEDDVGALAHELLSRRGARRRVGERGDVDAQGSHVRVDVLGANLEAVAELDHRRNVNAVNAGHRAGFGHHGGQRARQEAALVLAVLNAHQVLRRVLEELVHADEVNVGVVLGRFQGGVGDEEADRNEDVKALVNAGLDVLLVVGLRLGLDEVGLQAELLGGPNHALVGKLVERAVVDAPHVGNQTDAFDGLLASFRCWCGRRSAFGWGLGWFRLRGLRRFWGRRGGFGCGCGCGCWLGGLLSTGDQPQKGNQQQEKEDNSAHFSSPPLPVKNRRPDPFTQSPATCGHYKRDGEAEQVWRDTARSRRKFVQPPILWYRTKRETGVGHAHATRARADTTSDTFPNRGTCVL